MKAYKNLTQHEFHFMYMCVYMYVFVRDICMTYKPVNFFFLRMKQKRFTMYILQRDHGMLDFCLVDLWKY